MGNVVQLKVEASPIDEYRKVFPTNTPSCYQQDLILNTVTDIAAWKETLHFWAGNDYRPQSIQKMLEYYDDEVKGFHKKQYVPRATAGKTTKCSMCGNEGCMGDTLGKDYCWGNDAGLKV